jgi:hypothetical protein
MTDAAVPSLPVVAPLTLIGSPDAAVCDGDSCEIPAHSLVTLNIDSDEI